jgi:hypothetical protein
MTRGTYKLPEKTKRGIKREFIFLTNLIEDKAGI